MFFFSVESLDYTVVSIIVNNSVYSLCLRQVCDKGHMVYQWSSQPRMKARGVHLGDFMICTNILLSDNNFSKVNLLLRFCGLGEIPHSFFHKVQGLYLCPVIETFWADILERRRTELGQKPLILAGKNLDIRRL